MVRPLIERLLKVPVASGFRQEGYFVWCGSLIRAGGRYHLFASRWPESTGFPEGYRDHSEIVRATAERAIGPYRFAEVVVAGRGGAWWDGRMCHNPKIVRIGGTYVLYYIGSACGSGLRKVGYAWAPAVEGPWTRSEQPIPLDEDANNPAPYVHADGSVLLAYRDRGLQTHLARAPSFHGPYHVLARNIFPAGRLEDPDLFCRDGEYHMVMEDNQGLLTGHVRFGGHLVSRDGITWRPHACRTVYTHTIEYEDGTAFTAERRERPELFSDRPEGKGDGEPTHLITGVLSQGKTWCLVQPIAPEAGSGGGSEPWP